MILYTFAFLSCWTSSWELDCWNVDPQHRISIFSLIKTNEVEQKKEEAWNAKEVLDIDDFR